MISAKETKDQQPMALFKTPHNLFENYSSVAKIIIIFNQSFSYFVSYTV